MVWCMSCKAAPCLLSRMSGAADQFTHAACSVLRSCKVRLVLRASRAQSSPLRCASSGADWPAQLQQVRSVLTSTLEALPSNGLCFAVCSQDHLGCCALEGSCALSGLLCAPVS